MDKRVPITLILTLLIQAAAGLWFAAKMDARVAALEDGRIEQRLRDDRQDREVGAGVAILRSDMAYIRQQLDQLIRDGNGRGKQ